MADPATTELAVEVDSFEDQAIGSDLSSLYTDLQSGSGSFVYENGRRYHAYKEGQYFFPNDESELDREDMKHHATRLLLGGGLHTAQFQKPPKRALDIGTGTGIWAIDFADEHPDCRIIATDLSPVQPSHVPSNLEFQIDDLEDGWTFGLNSIDYIHIRYMATAVRDWPKLLGQARSCLLPGGIIELVDMDLCYVSDDGTLTESNYLSKFLEDITSAANTVGCNLRIASDYERLLVDAGFVEIRKTILKLPMGPWPKDRRLKQIGLFHRQQFLQGLEGIALGLFTRVLHWSREEVEVYLAKVREDINNRAIHGYWRIYFVTATKE